MDICRGTITFGGENGGTGSWGSRGQRKDEACEKHGNAEGRSNHCGVWRNEAFESEPSACQVALL